MARAGIGTHVAARLVACADSDASWFRFAALDAAVRMARSLVEGGVIRKGRQAESLSERLLLEASGNRNVALDIIPRTFWWALPASDPNRVMTNGAIVVHFRSRAAREARSSALLDAKGTVRSAPEQRASATADGNTSHASPLSARTDDEARVLSKPLRAELEKAKASTLRVLGLLLRAAAPRTLRPLGAALVLSVLVATVEIFVLRSIFEIDRYLTLTYQRGAAAFALASLEMAGAGLELAIARAASRLGTVLEVRFRAAFFEKLPRLEDAYLRSRPTSDMTSRAHAMHMLRDAPQLGARLFRASLNFVCAVTVIALLHPYGGWLAATGAGVSLLAFNFLRGLLSESMNRRRAHGAGLERFYLDALLGAVPIRLHGADKAVRREHEELLVEWVRAGKSVHLHGAIVLSVQLLIGTLTSLVLVAHYVSSGQSIAHLLVFVFFAMRLPSNAQEIVTCMNEWHQVQNVAMRLFAPLAGQETAASGEAPGNTVEDGPVHLRFDHVTVREAGHTILSDVSFDLEPGSLVAVVGSSGAGKSSLLGVLLGWLSASEGQVIVDGLPFDVPARSRLREETAWVDPGIYLWNRSLLDNVAFGRSHDPFQPLPEAIASSDLVDVLEHLTGGLHAPMGEGGTQISAGQGQRVRLARAMMRREARLVLLDEPFRGLDRARRRKLLAQARAHWKHATILLVSHDVSDTVLSDRVIVMDDGRLVEDGVPTDLMASPDSHFARLARADAEMLETAWSKARWQRRRIEGGAMVDAHRDGAEFPT
jgi:ATP-binding cassette subfamily B protein